MAQQAIPPAAPAATSRGYSIAAICVGALLIAIAFGIAKSDVNLPFTKLLVYSGVAALFAGIGANAAVTLNLPAAGQAGTAGGAAAIAIALCAVFGVDPPARLTMTYYINFAELGTANIPDDLKATVQILAPNQHTLGDPQDVPVTRAPGGNALKLTIVDISSDDLIILKLQSGRENKTWASASIHPNEGYMSLNVAALVGDH
jgi:hypothetical protein